MIIKSSKDIRVLLNHINFGVPFIMDDSPNPFIRVHMPRKMEEAVNNAKPMILQGKDVFIVDLKNGELYLTGGNKMVTPLNDSYFAIE